MNEAIGITLMFIFGFVVPRGHFFRGMSCAAIALTAGYFLYGPGL